MERTYCVYKHTNKVNGKVYIGITTKSPRARWDNGKGYRGNRHFWNAIQKYGWDGFEHEVLAENLEATRAFEMEKILIAECRSNLSEYGYNHSTGGEGGHAGVVCSEETRRKLREANLGDKSPMWGKPGTMLGRKHSDETKRRMSEARKGHRKTEDWVRKIAEAQKGTRTGSSSPCAKQVDQFTKDLVFVRRWNSWVEAAERFGIGADGITKVCRGSQKSAAGYIWRYATDNTSLST